VPHERRGTTTETLAPGLDSKPFRSSRAEGRRSYWIRSESRPRILRECHVTTASTIRGPRSRDPPPPDDPPLLVEPLPLDDPPPPVDPPPVPLPLEPFPATSIVQLNVADRPSASFSLIATEYVPAVVGVLVIVAFCVSTVIPGGSRPVTIPINDSAARDKRGNCQVACCPTERARVQPDGVQKGELAGSMIRLLYANARVLSVTFTVN